MYSSATVIITYYFRVVRCEWGYSSVVEHLTADQEVPSSNLGAPLFFLFCCILWHYTEGILSTYDANV